MKVDLPSRFLWLLSLVPLFCSTPAVADTACQTTLTFGSDVTTMNICISQHGNLVMFESPAGKEHIRVGVIGEGYEVCNFTTDTVYYDAAFTESGFGAPTIVQPNGANTLPLTITRDTTDGNFRLKQVFARDTTEKDVTITTTLTNTGAKLVSLHLIRFFDGDIDGSTTNRYATTIDSTWGWNNASGNGLSLTSLSFASNPSGWVSTFSDWQNGLATCSFLSQTTPTSPGDFVGFRDYKFSLAVGASKTVKVVYRRF